MVIINFIKILFWKLTNKKIMIINESAGLGDYLYVRNFFKLLKTSEYKDFKLIMCGTKRWKDFATKFDSCYVDLFIFFKNSNQPSFLERFIFKFFVFDIFINFRATFSEWSILSSIVKSKKIIDERNVERASFYIYKTNKIMSQLFKIPEDFKYSLDVIETNKTKMNNYAIVTLGGLSFGSLSVAQITAICNKLINDYKLKVLLLGTKKDKKLYRKVCSNIKEQKVNLINGCGIFKTYELPALIKKCKILVSPNTSTYHMSYLLGTKSVIISVNELASINLGAENIKYVFNNELDEAIKNNTVSDYQWIDLTIKDIPVEKILDAMDRVIKKSIEMEI